MRGRGIREGGVWILVQAEGRKMLRLLGRWLCPGGNGKRCIGLSRLRLDKIVRGWGGRGVINMYRLRGLGRRFQPRDGPLYSP